MKKNNSSKARLRKVLAMIFAVVMVLAIVAGVAAPAFAEEGPSPYYNPGEDEVAFWNILELNFDQTIDPSAPFQSGYAALTMDGVRAGHVAYISMSGRITIHGKWFFRHEEVAYMAESTYTYTLTVSEETANWAGWYLCRYNNADMVGSVSIGFQENDSVLEWVDVHEIATLVGVTVSADTDLDEAWEEFVVASGRSALLTAGTSGTTFSPQATVTRAQVVTMLWRAFGSPDAEGDVMPFEDVAEDTYYYTAVLWAAENGVTAGTSENTFSPKETCTRGEIAMFTYRAKELKDGEAPYSNTTWTVYDLSDESVEYAWERSEITDVVPTRYYAGAVGWTVLAVPVFSAGLEPDTFGPGEPCTRALCLLYAQAVFGDGE